MNDQQLETALAYLNENSGRYSLEALRGQLLQTGYDPATINWAIQVHQGNNPETPKPRTGRKILLVVGINAVLTVLFVVIANLPRSTEEVLGVLGSGLFLAGCFEMVGGIALCFPDKTRSWGLGLMLGFLLSVGLALLVLSGVCVYFLATEGGNFH
jgi:hypothetical protein